VGPEFTVTVLLGSGNFGAVWEARSGDGEPVALKVTHATEAAAVARLRREGELLARVGPPWVPAFRAGGTLADGRGYLAMERLQGRTLDSELGAWPGPPPAEVIGPLVEALLTSVAALHERGAVHRDLKPENVFIVRGEGGAPAAKLMDFGFAQVAAGAALSGGDAGAGTPEYMAPEQIAAREVDPRSDVYALGVMLFELYTLRLPFVGERRELEYAHLSFRPPRPSRFAAVPPAIEEVILRCLAKDPAARFLDGRALRTAFREALLPAAGGAGAEARPAGSAVTGKGALRGSDRQKVALVFVRGPDLSAVDVQEAVQPFGGQMAHSGPGRCVCAFTHRAGDDPRQRAMSAAEALRHKGLGTRFIVDVGTVVVKPRPDGPPRLMGNVFTQEARYPRDSDPEGILVTAAARPMLAGVGEEEPGRPDHFRLEASTHDQPTRTSMAEGPGPLIGREGELRELLDDADLAVNEHRPRVATVMAEAGLGKSRLSFELGRLLETRVADAQLLELRAREPLGNDADETLAELLRRSLALPSATPPDGGLALLRERLGEAGPEIHAAAALALRWIPPEHPAVQAMQAAPGALRANVARAAMEAIAALARRRPVLVVLDDAHWADDALLDALEQATASELPLWVSVFGRPAFAELRPTWGRRAAHARTVRLGPLDPAGAATLCRHLLRPAANVPEPVVARLVDRTEGRPLLLVDLVNGLRREGLLRQQAGGVWYVDTEVLDRVPDSPLVEWLAGRELEEQPAELAAHARLASLLSAEFTADEVQGVVHTMDAELSEAFPLDAAVGVDRLHQAGMLVRNRTGRFAFRTGLLREAVARTVTEAQATRIHQAALEFYRAALLPDATRLPRLAWHAAQAGARLEAAATYLTLAESARERHNYLEGDLLYTRALTHIDESDGRRRLRAFKGRGIMRYRLGRYDGSLADLDQALTLAVTSGDAVTEADVLLDQSMALDWLYEWRRSSELAERARALVEDPAVAAAVPSLHARVLLALGRSQQRFNEDREAAPLLREAVRLGAELGDEGYEVQVAASLLLGFMLPFLGLMDEAEEYLERASVLCQAKGDEMHLAAVWNNRACLWIARNDRDRFMVDTERVLAYGRRMGNASLERMANFNAAYYLYWRADHEPALPFVRRAIEIDERYFRQGGFRPDGAVLLARILWARGEEAASRALVEEVRRHQAEARDRGQSEVLLQPNDEMLLDLVALALQGQGVDGWEAMMSRARTVAQGQELIEALEVAGVVAERRRDGASARRWWGEALEAGARIPNVMNERIRQRLAALADS
jgi:tetratricopeptide (TPR) repeat protein